MAIPKGSYHELNARGPTGPVWPLQSHLVRAVAGSRPPPHVAAKPLPRCWSRGRAPIPLLLQGPHPLHLPKRLTHPRGLRAGASRPVLFRDGRGFHEFALLPGEHGGARGAAQAGGLGVDRRGGGSQRCNSWS